jgi:hypothetical protein
MSGFLKVMSGEPLADNDPFKGFKAISLGDGSSVEFKKNEEGFDVAVVSNPLHADDQTFLLDGNAYVLSNSGKTVASHGTNVTRVGEVAVLSNDVLANQLALLSKTDLTTVLNLAADKIPGLAVALKNIPQ